jgi:hypothetical protein
MSLNRIPEDIKLSVTDKYTLPNTSEGYDKQLGQILFFIVVFAYIYYQFIAW